MRLGGRDNRTVAAWFGGLAMMVQVFLPLLLAAEIRLATEGELPICHVGAIAEQSQQQPTNHTHRHATTHGCPICQAAAAAQAFTAAAAPSAPVPAFLFIIPATVFGTSRFESLFAASYSARAPPSLEN